MLSVLEAAYTWVGFVQLVLQEGPKQYNPIT